MDVLELFGGALKTVQAATSASTGVIGALTGCVSRQLLNPRMSAAAVHGIITGTSGNRLPPDGIWMLRSVGSAMGR